MTIMLPYFTQQKLYRYCYIYWLNIIIVILTQGRNYNQVQKFLRLDICCPLPPPKQCCNNDSMPPGCSNGLLNIVRGGGGGGGK